MADAQEEPRRHSAKPPLLKEKWMFVRNVMTNMDAQKKRPLQDRTNSMKATTQQTPTNDSFTQISEMFDQFRK